MSVARSRSGRGLAFTTALMVLLALAIPFMGVAVAAHGGATTAAIDVDQVTLTPESASLPPGGACVQFTAHATDGGAIAEGETLDILASLQDDDNPAGTTGESADTTLSFCDPDATGPGTDVGGDSDVDDDGGNESAASIHGECLTDLNGDCVFGLSVVDTGAGPGAATGSVTAFADFDNDDALDPAEPRDTATLTVGSGSVANISCTPATQSQPEGGRAEFTCTATNSAGQPLAGVLITGDVNAGPNTEEVPPFTCAATNAQGQTPTTGNPPTPAPGSCGYNDSTATTSPPGTDTVNFCVQAAAQPGSPSTAGCDPHELSAQGNATASVTWVGPASIISCVPDGQNATPGTTQLVTCQVSDINNQPSPAGVDCSFTETGPGTVSEQNSGLTNAQGQCSATATTFGNETGLQTITGTLVGGAGTNCNGGSAGTPATGAPAGTDCSDTASINWGGTTTAPPVTDCADGSDNDGDGEIDLNDRGCRSASDPTEAGPFASAITLRLRRAAPRGFTGQVASSFQRCQNGRAVSVRRIGRGVVGTDTTDNNGNYFIRFRGRRGRYQARVAPRTLTTASGDEIICQGDRSPIIGVRRRR